MQYIDNFLNKITMYRVVLYGLVCIFLTTLIFSIVGLISYSFSSIFLSFLILCFVCGLSNIIFAKIFKVETNVESVWITVFILTLILFPITGINDVWNITAVGFIAIASKYLLAINKKHIFNPVAIAIFISGILGSGLDVWWVGSGVLLLPIVIVGFLVVRKVRREDLFYSFFLASLFSLSFTAFLNSSSISEALFDAVLSGPLVFFATVMLTEPFTTPPKRKFRILYGIIVGLVYGADIHFGILYNSPALALILGNIFAFLVSPKDKLVLTLEEKKKLSPDIYEFSWKANKKLAFKAGQYLEWTLGHQKSDTRGNRRYFTISSSPTEDSLKLGIKFYNNSSSFKTKLVSLNVGDKVFASQLAGEFTLADDTKTKVVFIAGGIGVTPFRSMAKFLTDKNEKRDIVLLFSNKTANDIVYKDIFDQARNIGLKTLYMVGDLAGQTESTELKVGQINADLIKKEIPDYKERVFYISGPHVMVDSFQKTLKDLGIPARNVKVDFFPGFV